MAIGRELLDEKQLNYLERMDIDPDQPEGTLEEIRSGWVHGAMCGMEFLYETKCDASGGGTSINSCGPHGCPFLWVTKPSMDDPKHAGNAQDLLQDALEYPVYRVPTLRIGFRLLREFQSHNIAVRAMHE